MHKYLFVLGREWKLSASEILSVFGEDHEALTHEILCKNFSYEFEDPQAILDNLGGTVKIAKVFDEAKSLGDAEAKIINYLNGNFDGKCVFALSLYNISAKLKNVLRKLLKNIKDALRDRGKVRFLNKPGENIRSVVVSEEKLHKKGTDILVFKNGGNFLLATTVAVQNFKKYSKRDYNRPCRDAKSGMLPPKLAQIMINLACGDASKNVSKEKSKLIYDPFCGSGTVLMEAMLMGYKVIGSDISEKAVACTDNNIGWLCEKFKVDKPLLKDLFVKDATKIGSKDLKTCPDFIVTETYLGPPLFKLPSKKEMDVNFGNVQRLVLDFMKRILPIIGRNGTMLIAVPFYRRGNTVYYMENLVEKVQELGYDVSGLFGSGKRGSLEYSRKDQVVGREVFKFTVPG